MTVLGRTEKGIRRKMSEKAKEKQQLGKLWSMLKTERSLTQREKQKYQWGGDKAIRHILRGKRRWLDGVGLRVDWRAMKELWAEVGTVKCQWMRQAIAGAGLWDNKWKRRADYKVVLCHLPPVDKKQIQCPSFMNQSKEQLIKKVHTVKHVHSKYICAHAHTPFLPRL